MISTKSKFLEGLEDFFSPKSNDQQKAWEMLSEVGLPHKKSEAYKYTPIVNLLEKEVDLGLSDEALLKPDFYQTEGSHLVLRNGSLITEESKIKDSLQIEVNTPSEGRHDPFSLLNASLSQEELVITIANHSEPVFIYQLNTVGICNPRIKFLVQSGKSVDIYQKSWLAQKSFTNSYISFELGKNASANYTVIQNYDAKAFTHETILADQERDSRFYVNTFSFAAGLIRNNLVINQKDENCESHMHGLYLLDGKSQVDNNTTVDHQMPNSYSNELYKGILDEKSKGVFNGKIYVRQEAQKTNAFQSNNNILLSDAASVNTKPQLEIWADDVKCSHGCTTGQLDEDAIFYLRSRGIDEKNAKAMILNAFASETVGQVGNEEVKEELLALIGQKLV